MGGRNIWQLSDSGSLLVTRKGTPEEDPEVVESKLIYDYIAVYGSRPLLTAKWGEGLAVGRQCLRTA